MDSIFGESSDEDEICENIGQGLFLAIMQFNASHRRELTKIESDMNLQIYLIPGNSTQNSVAWLVAKLRGVSFGSINVGFQKSQETRPSLDILVFLERSDSSSIVDVVKRTHIMEGGLVFVPGALNDTSALANNNLHYIGEVHETSVLRFKRDDINHKGGSPVWCPDPAMESDLVAAVTVHCFAEEHLRGDLCKVHHTQAVNALNTYGVVIFRGLFDAHAVMMGGTAATQDFRTSMEALKRRGIDLERPGEGPAIENFHELSMREARRCDVRNGKRLNEFNAHTRSVAAIDGPCNLRAHRGLLGVMSEVMNPHWDCENALGNWGRWNFGGDGPEAGPPPVKIGDFGAVMTLPGALPQTLHADTAHTHPHVQLPAHYMNLFLPATAPHAGEDIEDDSRFAAGQTAFVLGSHVLSDAARMLREAPAVEGDPDGHMARMPELERCLIRPHLLPGDALIFDCRCLHFGLENRSENTTRALLYLNYYQDYFNDPKNWNDADRLLE